MSIADRLAAAALEASDRVTDPEAQRICAYVFDQATGGTRTEADLTHLDHTLTIRTRSL